MAPGRILLRTAQYSERKDRQGPRDTYYTDDLKLQCPVCILLLWIFCLRDMRPLQEIAQRRGDILKMSQRPWTFFGGFFGNAAKGVLEGSRLPRGSGDRYQLPPPTGNISFFMDIYRELLARWINHSLDEFSPQDLTNHLLLDPFIDPSSPTYWLDLKIIISLRLG